MRRLALARRPQPRVGLRRRLRGREVALEDRGEPGRRQRSLVLALGRPCWPTSGPAFHGLAQRLAHGGDGLAARGERVGEQRVAVRGLRAGGDDLPGGGLHPLARALVVLQHRELVEAGLRARAGREAALEDGARLVEAAEVLEGQRHVRGRVGEARVEGERVLGVARGAGEVVEVGGTAREQEPELRVVGGALQQGEEAALGLGPVRGLPPGHRLHRVEQGAVALAERGLERVGLAEVLAHLLVAAEHRHGGELHVRRPQLGIEHGGPLEAPPPVAAGAVRLEAFAVCLERRRARRDRRRQRGHGQRRRPQVTHAEHHHQRPRRRRGEQRGAAA